MLVDIEFDFGSEWLGFGDVVLVERKIGVDVVVEEILADDARLIVVSHQDR